MTKHEYKFGDRVTYSAGTDEECRGVVTGFDSYGDPVVHFEDGDYDAYEPGNVSITPGWPSDDDGETVTVRAAVLAIIDNDGPAWEIAGRNGDNDENAASRVRNAFGEGGMLSFIEAYVPVEQNPQTIEAEVVS